MRTARSIATWTFVSVFVLASAVAQGCGKSEPKTHPNPPAGVAKSPFPPPPIEIGSDDGDKKIYWALGTTNPATRIPDTGTETNGRISDEITWRVTYLKIVDLTNTTQTDVQWASINDGLSEKAVVKKNGGQFAWTVAGVMPGICSWYNITTEVPACVHNGTPIGFTGIPSSLFGFVPTFRARFMKNGAYVEEEVKKILLRGQTCP